MAAYPEHRLHAETVLFVFWSQSGGGGRGSSEFGFFHCWSFLTFAGHSGAQADCYNPG